MDYYTRTVCYYRSEVEGILGLQSIVVSNQLIKYFYILYQCWNNTHKQRTRCFQAWVCVDLYQPHIKVFVYHEVQAEEFKRILPSTGIHSPISSPKRVLGERAHLRIHFLHKVKSSALRVHVDLEFLEAHLISLLIATIILTSLLYSIIGQVDHFRREILSRELL